MSVFKFINILKVANFGLISVSYGLSRIFHSNIYAGVPYFISFEISSICNLNCSQCERGAGSINRKNKFFDFNLYKNILKVNGKYMINTILYFQGEPLLNKQFYDYVSEAKKYNIYTQTSTNAQLIDDEIAEKLILCGLDKIIISIDGITQNSYSKYRLGGDINKVINAIDKIVEAKKKYNSNYPIIEAQFIVFSHNENEIESFKKFCKEHKVDKCTLKTAQLIDANKDFYLLPKNEKYSRYKKCNDKWITKKGIKHPCFRTWGGAVIDSDGNVVPCCFDKNCNLVFGNLNEKEYNYNIATILKNDKAKKFREKLISNRASINICNNCNE